MSTKFSFSSTEDQVLIALVENNKVILDSAHKKHKDHFWKKISEKVGRSSDDCKKRWKNMRDTYMKRKKKLSTGSAAPCRKSRNSTSLSFLDTVQYEKSTLTNVDTTDANSSNTSTADEIGFEDGENVQNDEKQTVNIMSDLPSTSYAGKRIRSKEDKILTKRSKDTKDTILSIQEQNKSLATSMKNPCEEDDTDVFFKSIAMTVKKMSPQAIKEAKLKTLTLITEIDDKYSSHENYNT